MSLPDDVGGGRLRRPGRGLFEKKNPTNIQALTNNQSASHTEIQTLPCQRQIRRRNASVTSIFEFKFDLRVSLHANFYFAWAFSNRRHYDFIAWRVCLSSLFRPTVRMKKNGHDDRSLLVDARHLGILSFYKLHHRIYEWQQHLTSGNPGAPFALVIVKGKANATNSVFR